MKTSKVTSLKKPLVALYIGAIPGKFGKMDYVFETEDKICVTFLGVKGLAHEMLKFDAGAKVKISYLKTVKQYGYDNHIVEVVGVK